MLGFDALPGGDVKPRFVTTSDTIRLATEADIPALLARAARFYPGRDVAAAGNWLHWCIHNPDRLVLFGPASGGVAEVNWHYGFELRGRLAVLFGGGTWETFIILRRMVEWARSKGAKGSFRIDADTGVDLRAFAARLGGSASMSRRYEIPIGE